MAHGYPDYGVAASVASIYRALDPGELAVRLDSVVTYDRRGNVLFADGFEGGLGHWLTYAADTGDAASLGVGLGRIGSYAALCTLGGGALNSVQLTRYLAYAQSSRFGLEVSFAVLNQVKHVWVQLNWNHSAHSYAVTVAFYPTTGVLRLEGVSSGYVVLDTGIVLAFDEHAWATCKLVFDPVLGKVIRVLFNARAYSTAQYAAIDLGAAPRDQVGVNLYASSNVGQTSSVYFDDVILTQNED